MIPGKRMPLLTFSTVLGLILLSVVAILLFFLSPLDGRVRLAVMVLSVFLVIVLVFRGRSEQRKLERDIFRLTAIINSSEDAIISKTLDGTILTWNRGAERLFGYSAGEVVGKSVQITYPPDRLDEFEQILERLKRGESLDLFDTVRVAKDGRRIDVSISESLIRDTQGRAIGVSKIVRDISDLVRAREVLTRSKEELERLVRERRDKQ